MLETPNLKLKKPEDNDTLDPSLSINPNMDIIDKAYKKLEDDVKNASSDAAGTSFDSSTSGLGVTNVQDAIDKVNAKAEANKTSIFELQTELGSNKSTLQNNITEIREVL